MFARECQAPSPRAPCRWTDFLGGLTSIADTSIFRSKRMIYNETALIRSVFMSEVFQKNDGRLSITEDRSESAAHLRCDQASRSTQFASADGGWMCRRPGRRENRSLPPDVSIRAFRRVRACRSGSLKMMSDVLIFPLSRTSSEGSKIRDPGVQRGRACLPGAGSCRRGPRGSLVIVPRDLPERRLLREAPSVATSGDLK